MPEMAPLLIKLIEESAAPLASIESNFAVDSTGFGTSTYRRWYDAKYGKEMCEHAWLKAHAMVGVKTGIVTAVKVTGPTRTTAPSCPRFSPRPRRRFDVAEVSADKAYLSRANLDAVEAAGAVPYIPFKSNSKGARPGRVAQDVGLLHVPPGRVPGALPPALQRRDRSSRRSSGSLAGRFVPRSSPRRSTKCSARSCATTLRARARDARAWASRRASRKAAA